MADHYSLSRFLRIFTTLTTLHNVAFGGSLIEPAVKTSTICKADKCDEISKLLKSWQDSTVKPCDDFYNFVCGKFSAPVGISDQAGPEVTARDIIDTAIRDSLHSIDAKDPKVPLAMRKAKSFHESCVRCDPSQLPPSKEVIEYFNNFANWPFLTRAAWDDSKFDVHTVAGRLFGELGVTTIASLFIDNDRSQVNQKVLILREPLLADTQNLNQLKVLLQPYLKEPYVAKVTKILSIMSEAASMHYTAEEIAHTANDIVDFEIQLSQSIVDTIFSENNDPPTVAMYLRDANNFYAGAKPSWTKFFQAAFRGNEEGMKWLTDHQLKVAHSEYFSLLYSKLLLTPTRTVANYMMMKLLSKLGPYINESLPDDSRNLKSDNNRLPRRSAGNNNRIPRQTDMGPFDAGVSTEQRDVVCVGQLKKFFPNVAARLYLTKQYPAEKKKTVRRIADDVVKSMETIFTESTWLSPEAKKRFVAKLRKMKLNVGYPEWIMNDVELNRVQSQNDGNQVDNRCFTSSMAYRKWDFSPLLRNSSVREEFQLPITSDRDSVYMLNLNALTVPAGSLEFPFWSDPQTDAFNYALIGFIVGHEISHGFDNLGVFYNEDGVKNNDVFTKSIPSLVGLENLPKFKEMNSCLTEAYSKNCFSVGVFNWTKRNTCVDGSRTLGENQADIIGLKAAYKAYKLRNTKPTGTNMKLPRFQSFTLDQTFFISYASQWCSSVGAYHQLLSFVTGDHSPNKARVNEVLRQTPEFSKVFGCRPKQQMFSANPCRTY